MPTPPVPPVGDPVSKHEEQHRPSTAPTPGAVALTSVNRRDGQEEQAPVGDLHDRIATTARARAALFRELCNPTEWISGERGATDRDANQLIDTFAAAVRGEETAARDAQIARLRAALSSIESAAERAHRRGYDLDPEDILAAARATAEPSAAVDPDEWVRCARPHCPNAERCTKATERGWQHGHMDTWLCPKHTTATTRED